MHDLTDLAAATSNAIRAIAPTLRKSGFMGSAKVQWRPEEPWVVVHVTIAQSWGERLWQDAVEVRCRIADALKRAGLAAEATNGCVYVYNNAANAA